MNPSRIQKRAVMAKMAPILWGKKTELGGLVLDEYGRAGIGNVGSYGRPSLLECRANLNLN